MTSRLPGISGSLFPGRYLTDDLARGPGAARRNLMPLERKRQQMSRWWAGVADTCGPATSVRALFDLIAMPLFAQLGFRARDPRFEPRSVRVRLETTGGTPVGLVILPWASRPSAIWRDATNAARPLGAEWCFVLAPPFLSLVDARGHAFRRSVDFSWPAVVDARSFAIFWTLAHASSFDQANGTIAIDAWIAAGAQFQDRVRDDLQHGVIAALGALEGALRGSRVAAHTQARFDEALTLVYRVLFLLFAESRDLVPGQHPIYGNAYALATLCRKALRAPSPAGLWDGLAAITRLSRAGCRTDDLIVRPFNGRLFAKSAAPSLEQTRAAPRSSGAAAARDRSMQSALVALATRKGPAGREEINYADLGVEQLGAVYERVLDLEPGRRKQSGTFYTPQALAEFVVRRTLAPLVSGASSDAILAPRVLDPAMGSGAFLVAACRYLSTAYERALIDEGRCGETDLDDDTRADIRRLISERCLAGVDVNPVAVQLARLSLWLATLARGKPLGFLDHRLRVGNSLVGASPDDLRVITDGRRSMAATTHALPLFDAAGLEHTLSHVARPLFELLARRDETVDDVRAKEALWTRLTSDRSATDPVRRLRLAASLWCSRWFWSDAGAESAGSPPSPAETRAAIAALLRSDATLNTAHLSQWLRATQALETRHRFFHWPLEFADVFYDESGRPRERPGFDAVIGNPPWEMLRQDPQGSRARGGAEPRSLLTHFIRESGLYPSCARGHVNLYQPFLDRSLTLTRAGGRVGLVLPWGLATDDGAAQLRARLLDQASVDTIVGLDNASGIFPIHRGLRFLVVVAGPGRPTREIRARFGVRTSRELDELPDGHELVTENESPYPVRLTPRLIAAVGGAMRRIPDVRHTQDLQLLERLTREVPRLGDATGWHARFGRELNATEDRDHFGARGLPVIDGKHIQPFVTLSSEETRRIERRDAERLLPDGLFERARLAYRDVSGVGNRVSLIAAIVPGGTVTTHTLFCLRTTVALDQQQFLCGLFNSYVLNAVARMLMGGHATTSLVEGLPVPVWRGTERERRIARLAKRLSARPEAAHWNALLQAEVARLYGLDDTAFGRVLEGFPLVPPEARQRAREALRAISS